MQFNSHQSLETKLLVHVNLEDISVVSSKKTIALLSIKGEEEVVVFNFSVEVDGKVVVPWVDEVVSVSRTKVVVWVTFDSVVLNSSSGFQGISKESSSKVKL